MQFFSLLEILQGYTKHVMNNDCSLYSTKKTTTTSSPPSRHSRLMTSHTLLHRHIIAYTTWDNRHLAHTFLIGHLLHGDVVGTAGDVLVSPLDDEDVVAALLD